MQRSTTDFGRVDFVVPQCSSVEIHQVGDIFVDSICQTGRVLIGDCPKIDGFDACDYTIFREFIDDGKIGMKVAFESDVDSDPAPPSRVSTPPRRPLLGLLRRPSLNCWKVD